MNHPDLPKKPGNATSSKKLNPATKLFGYNPLMVALLTEEVADALRLAFASPIKDHISYEYLKCHAPINSGRKEMQFSETKKISPSKRNFLRTSVVVMTENMCLRVCS